MGRKVKNGKIKAYYINIEERYNIKEISLVIIIFD